MRLLKYFLLTLLIILVSTPVNAQNFVLTHNPWVAQASMIAADTSKTIKAAPGTGRQLFITFLSCTITTSAAQTVDIQDTSGTNFMLRLAISAGVNTQYVVGPLQYGLPLVVNEALIIKPAAAGPAGHCIAEGYIRG